MQRPLTPTFAIFGLQVEQRKRKQVIGFSGQRPLLIHRLPAVHNVCEIVIEGHSLRFIPAVSPARPQTERSELATTRKYIQVVKIITCMKATLGISVA